MNKETTITVLNKIIEINNERIEGYETASKETTNKELNDLFFQFIQTSKKCNTELISEVLQFGGLPEEKTKIIGKFFRVWMNLKAAFTNNDQNAILLSCDYGESKAIQVYNKVLKNNNKDLNNDQIRLIERQLILINRDLDSLRDLRSKLLVLA